MIGLGSDVGSYRPAACECSGVSYRRAEVETADVSGYTVLRVGPVRVLRSSGVPGDELLAVFRDDMRTVMRFTGREFLLRYSVPGDPRIDGEQELDVAEFRASGQAAAARLDLLGVTEEDARADLDAQLSLPRAPGWEERAAGLRGSRRLMLPRTRRRLDEWDKRDLEEVRRGDELRGSLSADGWLRMLGSSAEETPFVFGIGTGGRSWLMSELDGWDLRRALRAVMLAFPEADVVLAVADRAGPPGWAALSAPRSGADAAVRSGEGGSAPVVVLTEGRTDAEFLAAGLKVLRPYLTDLIRFLDYERRPEGGAGPLAGMVRAFAAAGIANRVVAVFDNDTAATAALRSLRKPELPPQIKVIQYPDLSLAQAYPALGPPDPESSESTPRPADVNGLAASIEMYLGRDVLTGPDGTLYPVRWISYDRTAGRHQGRFDDRDKTAIHKAFRAKAKAALGDPAQAGQQDWSGLLLIIDAIFAAAKHTTTAVHDLNAATRKAT
jgi:hypothetical protein